MKRMGKPDQALAVILGHSCPNLLLHLCRLAMPVAWRMKALSKMVSVAATWLENQAMAACTKTDKEARIRAAWDLGEAFGCAEVVVIVPFRKWLCR